jgi:hypothetical protein
MTEQEWQAELMRVSNKEAQDSTRMLGLALIVAAAALIALITWYAPSIFH